LLLTTLRSVLAQRDVGLSVVIVDDASTDGSVSAVKSLRDPRVRLVSHVERRGVSQARNTGLEHAQTPWVAFVDDDDLWAPDKVASQVTAAVATGSLWACVGAIHVDKRLRIIGWNPGLPSGDISAPMNRGNAVPGGGSGVLVTTELARSLGGFDVSLSTLADWDFYLRLCQRSPVASVNRPLVGYRVHAASMSFNHRLALDDLDRLANKCPAVDSDRFAKLLLLRSPNLIDRLRSLAQLVQSEHDLRVLTHGIALLPLWLQNELRVRRSRHSIPPEVSAAAEAWLTKYRPVSARRPAAS